MDYREMLDGGGCGTFAVLDALHYSIVFYMCTPDSQALNRVPEVCKVTNKDAQWDSGCTFKIKSISIRALSYNSAEQISTCDNLDETCTLFVAFLNWHFNLMMTLWEHIVSQWRTQAVGEAGAKIKIKRALFSSMKKNLHGTASCFCHLKGTIHQCVLKSH